jgi:hypothetical protein
MVSEARNRRCCSSGGGGGSLGVVLGASRAHTARGGAPRGHASRGWGTVPAPRGHTPPRWGAARARRQVWGGGKGDVTVPGSTRARTAGGGAPRGHAGRGEGRIGPAPQGHAPPRRGAARAHRQGRGSSPAPQGYTPLGGAPRGHAGRWGFAPVPPRSRKEGRGVRRRGMVARA